jgi:LEA14-like dessication related protein
MAKHTRIAGFKITTPLAIIGGVVVVAGIIAFPVWQMARRISVAGIKARIQNLTAFGANIRLSVAIQNRSSLGLPIDFIEGDLTWGKYLLGTVNSTQSFVIEAGQITEAGLDVNLNWQNLGTNVFSLIKKGGWMQGLNFKGTVMVKGIRVPINQNIQIL